MMKIQKLGGLGKFKVATVTAITALFSVVVIQCNSKLEDQSLAQTQPFAVDLPVIENNDYVFDVNTTERMDVVIQNDKVFIDNEEVKPGNFGQDWKDVHPKTQVVLQVDKDQSMKLVHEVQEQLRKLDLRLIVYTGKGRSGEIANIPFMLPPAPNSSSPIRVPALTDEFIKKNGIEMIEMNMDRLDINYGNFVYNALHNPMIPKGSFVFRGRYYDDTSYEEYLTSLTKIKQGFYRLYDERAYEMFGKSFFDINRERKIIEEAQQQYKDVREGYPMSIVMQKL